MDILDAIGNTSLVRLRRVVPSGGAAILAKLEWENPSGSMKDRMARAVITRAEADGRLKAGDTIVEYTGGSTGVSLALVCAARGFRVQIVTSDAFSRDKRDQMAAYGAELTLVPSEGGLTTRKLILDMIEAARVLSREPHMYWTDQLNNHDSIAGYFGLGEEIWSETGGRVDAFVQTVGTAASSRGVATILKRHHPGVRIVVVEPAESPVLAGGQPGPHKIEGVGIGFMPPLWDPTLADEIIAVRTEDAKEMARRITREEGLFAGTSSGANVIAGGSSRVPPRSRRERGHADGRLGAQVSQHGRVREPARPLVGSRDACNPPEGATVLASGPSAPGAPGGAPSPICSPGRAATSRRPCHWRAERSPLPLRAPPRARAVPGPAPSGTRPARSAGRSPRRAARGS